VVCLGGGGIGGEQLLAIHEKSSNEDNLMNICQSEATRVKLDSPEAQMHESPTKTSNVKFKPLLFSLRH
jgi:hypothetical protein